MKETFNIDKDWIKYIFDTICTGWEGSQMLFPIRGSDGTYMNITVYPQTIMDAIAVSADLQIRKHQASEHLLPRKADEIN